jgi:undecaprenyl-diphosphatase
MDFSLYRSLNDPAFDHRAFGDTARFVAENAQWLLVGLLAVVALSFGAWRSVQGRRAVLSAGVSAVAALAVAQLIGSLWDRARPYEAHPSAHLLLTPSPDPSFPSDHAIAAFAIAVSLLLANRRAGIAALIVAIVLCVARVAAGTHYPSDVVGGALIGSAAALLVRLPPLGRALDSVADRVGSLYDRLVARMLPSGASAA